MVTVIDGIKQVNPNIISNIPNVSKIFSPRKDKYKPSITENNKENKK
tara:strand:- start:964 stop:1104 length:141 start_codon:yes stop_codon:yes gene_type:complete